MGQINVFGGGGFVGSRYCELTPNVIKNHRSDYEIKSNEVVYFISTIDNYNVHTDPYIDIDTNLTTFIKVLESHRKENIPDLTFNFISSWFVYGSVDLPAKEDAHCDPKGFYSITKRAAEQLLISYCETFGIKYRILRLPNVIGPQDHKVSKKKNALQYMINEIKNNRPIQLYDGGRCYRDYMYVDDVVGAINTVIKSGGINEIYNIGRGIPVWLDEVIDSVVQRTGSTSAIENIPPAEFHTKVQATNMVLDVNKLHKLGFNPKYTMSDMLDILCK